MRNALPCVGLVVLAGCFTFIVVPDSEVSWLQPPQPSPPKNVLPTVVIDPGHGGNDEGTKWHGLAEKNLTLDLALRIEQMLKSYNFPTVVTRRDDTYVALSERATLANEHENSIFVSLHFNSDRDPNASGAETYFSADKARPPSDWSWVGIFNKKPEPPQDNGAVLAGFIQASLVMKTDLRNRGIKSRRLFVTRNVYSPSVLVEAGFVSNPIEAALLQNADYRQRLAGAIAEGILSYQKTRPQPRERPQLAKAQD